MARVAPRRLTLAGVESIPLTTSYVALDPIPMDFSKRFTVYPFYTRGAGGGANTLQYQIQFNPYAAATLPTDTGVDPNDIYWTNFGVAIFNTNTWTLTPAEYTSGTGTAGVQENVVATQIDQLDAFRMRILVKETVNAGSAGELTMVIAANDPVNSH